MFYANAQQGLEYLLKVLPKENSQSPLLLAGTVFCGLETFGRAAGTVGMFLHGTLQDKPWPLAAAYVATVPALAALTVAMFKTASYLADPVEQDATYYVGGGFTKTPSRFQMKTGLPLQPCDTPEQLLQSDALFVNGVHMGRSQGLLLTEGRKYAIVPGRVNDRYMPFLIPTQDGNIDPAYRGNDLWIVGKRDEVRGFPEIDFEFTRIVQAGRAITKYQAENLKETDYRGGLMISKSA